MGRCPVSLFSRVGLVASTGAERLIPARQRCPRVRDDGYESEHGREAHTDPVAIDGAVAKQSYIQWPDGTGISLQLHHPEGWDWRNGNGSVQDLYRDLQNLLHQVLLGVDMGEVWDFAQGRLIEEGEQGRMQGGA